MISDEPRLSPRWEVERLLGLEADAPRAPRHSWWRIGRGGSTRFLIPTHRPAVKTALQLVSDPWNYWGLRAALWGAGYLRRPRPIGTTLGRTPLDELLAPVFPGQRLVYAVYFGTPSLYRKFTIQCQDEQGRALAYAKISDGSRAPASMRNEASVLRQLEASPALRASVPAVLELTEAWGRCISVLSSPVTRYRRAPAFPTGAITGYLRELFTSEVAAAAWAPSPVRARAVEAAATLNRANEAEAANLLRRAVSMLDAGFGEAVLPHGRAHGDFLPWNVRLVPDLYVFDWEWSRMALPFHDLYHYLIFAHLGARRGRSMSDLYLQLRSERVRERLQDADPGALPFPSTDPRWLHAYLVDAFAFYAESTTANGQALRDSQLIGNLQTLLQIALDGKP